MATKTLTIMEDVYQMLAENKMKGESFSDELRRILSRKKSRKWSDLKGLLNEEEGNNIIKDLEKIKKMNLKLLKEKL